MIDNEGLNFTDDSEDDLDYGKHSSFKLLSFDKDKHPVDHFVDKDGSGIGIAPGQGDSTPQSLPPLKPIRLNPQTTDSSQQQKKKKKKRSSEKDNNEVDSRPDSDRHQFDSLQHAKAQHRRDNQQRMAITTRGGSVQQTAKDGELSATVSRKRSSAEQSPAEVSRNSSDNDTSTPETQPGTGNRPPKSGGGSGKSGPSGKTSFASFEEAAKGTTQDIDQMCANQRLVDSKLNKDKKFAALVKCRRTILVQRVTIGKYHVEQANLLEKIARLEAAAAKSNSRSKAAKLRVVDELMKKFEEKTKEVLFQSVKFLSSGDELERATEKVVNYVGLGDRSPEEIDSLVVTYKNVVKVALGKQRNYLIAELKKLAFDMMDHTVELPTPGVLFSLAMRQVPDTNLKLFQWYWTKVLPKIVFSKKWSPDIFFYTTILDARLDAGDKSSKALFTVSHEAMICLVWENNYEKWQQQHKHKKQNPTSKCPKIPGKYSSSDKGQVEWGGWSTEGLTKYNELKKAIRSRRQTHAKEIRALEQKTLAALRLEAGIDCEDHDQQQRKNRAKKRKIAANKPVEEVQVQKKVSTYESDDDE